MSALYSTSPKDLEDYKLPVTTLLSYYCVIDAISQH